MPSLRCQLRLNDSSRDPTRLTGVGTRAGQLVVVYSCMYGGIKSKMYLRILAMTVLRLTFPPCHPRSRSHPTGPPHSPLLTSIDPFCSLTSLLPSSCNNSSSLCHTGILNGERDNASLKQTGAAPAQPRTQVG